MKILFWSFLISFQFLVLHVFVWKVRLPKSQTKTLWALSFIGTIILSVIFYFNLGRVFIHSPFFLPLNRWEYCHILLFYFLLVFAYITFYTAVEADSPSLVMITKIAEAGSKGLDRNELDKYVNDNILVKPRLIDLVQAKMVVEKDGVYRLTLSGIIFVRFFIFFRRLLRLGKGG